MTTTADPTPPATPPPAGVPASPYRAPRTWAIGLLIVLALTLVLDAVAIGSDIAELRLLGDPASLTESRADTNDDRQRLIGQLQLGCFLVAAVLFIGWLRRITANLPAIGVRGLRFGPGWAIGAWFVPILNLWRPKQIVDDAWRASDPELPDELNLNSTERRVPFHLGVWWAVWLASHFIGRIAAQQTRNAEELSEIVTGSRWLLAADFTSLVADIAALAVVITLTRRHALRAERILGARSLHATPAA